jgi:hypothetical protein
LATTRIASWDDKAKGIDGAAVRNLLITSLSDDVQGSHWPEMLAKLEAELSILNDPGEYESLPAAVVAEELGLSIGLVEALIQCGEIEPTNTSEESKRDRVSRDELARDELLRIHEKDAAPIFEDSLRHLQDGDLEAAEKAYRRIEVRDSFIGH